MLVVFSPIFLADTKIIFRYDFVAPLSGHNSKKQLHIVFQKQLYIDIFQKQPHVP